ncbi:queuosine precursor transporter [Salinibaculum rarum]|uniref:queuosine precursor transporter n=1 Tax=Salinibaculum rarum TaxID=3058903 RepID=UPI00265F5BE4|nr:queuosine precursor transporter [Salinibaculum sp. KK48]
MSSNDPLGGLQIALVALFVTALVTAQVTASKVLAFGLPFSLPLTGDAIILPGAAVAYALTFFATDCYSELYGRRPAQVLVNVGFAANFVFLGLAWLAIGLPIAANSPVPQDQFSSVIGASTGIVAGSLVAYLVSQNWDVLVFHRLRAYTDGDALWFRNIASTASSQLIDTILFISIAFVLFQGMPLDVAVGLMVGQYIFKLGVALLDTPFVYAVVRVARGKQKPQAVTAD